MTLVEAVHAVRVLSMADTRKLRGYSADRMLRKVATWRVREPEAWREIRDHVCGKPQHSGGQYRLYGKPKATLAEVLAKREAQA